MNNNNKHHWAVISMTEEDRISAATIRKRGLCKMVAGFVADLCPLCLGACSRRSTYTAGCGMGYYQAFGVCDYCKGLGLVVGGRRAPESVLNQVLTAGREIL